MTAITTDAMTTLDQRVLEAATGTLELFGVYLGDRLGLYDALRDTPRSAPELAAAAGIAPRYAREWLEQQAVAGVLRSTTTALSRTYAASVAVSPRTVTSHPPNSSALLTVADSDVTCTSSGRWMAHRLAENGAEAEPETLASQVAVKQRIYGCTLNLRMHP